MADFKYLVIGRGMMGAAAARHLALQVDGVGVIGPDEPADMRRHDGVFASHYDEGRITRTIDPNETWARFANRSIARYGEIAEQSGMAFYSQVGCLVAAASRASGETYIGDILDAAGKLGVETALLDDAGLAGQFPFFSFEPGSEGVFEAKGAGYISPRRLVAAQSALAEKAGARIIRETAVKTVAGRDSVEVTTAEGHRYTADRVLVAAGGFSIAENLLPQPLEMQVYGRTVVFMEVEADEATRLAAMPSLITQPSDPRDSIYMLPPVRYPDGRHYLKIGGDPDNLHLKTEADIRAWFRGDGRAEVREHLLRIARSLLKDAVIGSVSTAACVTSYTPTGVPAIGFTSSPRIAVLTGGCGAAAKSSDEIGRLGAGMMLTGEIDCAYDADFRPRFL